LYKNAEEERLKQQEIEKQRREVFLEYTQLRKKIDFE